MSHVKHVAQALTCALIFGIIAWLFFSSVMWDFNVAEWSGFTRFLFSFAWLSGLVTGLVVKPGGFA